MATLEDELGDVVSKARVGTGRTAQQVSDMVGISPGDIEDIETYRLTPDSGRLAKLAEVLSLDPGKLIALANDGWQPPDADLAHLGVLVAPVEVPHRQLQGKLLYSRLPRNGLRSRDRPGRCRRSDCLAGYRSQAYGRTGYRLPTHTATTSAESGSLPPHSRGFA